MPRELTPGAVAPSVDAAVLRPARWTPYSKAFRRGGERAGLSSEPRGLSERGSKERPPTRFGEIVDLEGVGMNGAPSKCATVNVMSVGEPVIAAPPETKIG